MKLTIGWLYYDLMNTYGDQGNVLILKHRAEARQIKVEVANLSLHSTYHEIQSCDLLLMGGAEDRQQEIVVKDLVNEKRQVLKDKIEQNVPALFICGAYQFLGQFYRNAEGNELKCLGLLPFHTIHPGPQANRLIGDIVVKITNHRILSYFDSCQTNITKKDYLLVGFENHGGRTQLTDNDQALGTVLKGHGNNDHDHFEGFVSHNTIGTYLHGPLLPRSPFLADYLLVKALELKYNHEVELKPLKNELERANQKYLLKQLNVKNTS